MKHYLALVLGLCLLLACDTEPTPIVRDTPPTPVTTDPPVPTTTSKSPTETPTLAAGGALTETSQAAPCVMVQGACCGACPPCCTGADLSSSDLPNMDLSDAYLDGANLSGLDLRRQRRMDVYSVHTVLA